MDICVVLERRDDTLLLDALFNGDPEKLVSNVRAHGIGVTQAAAVSFRALDNLLRALILSSLKTFLGSRKPRPQLQSFEEKGRPNEEV